MEHSTQTEFTGGKLAEVFPCAQEITGGNTLTLQFF
jgi:hypothetical protein